MPLTSRLSSPVHYGCDGKSGFPEKGKPAPERARKAVTILVVDDQGAMARVIQRALSQDGREVRTAGNGGEGLAAFRECMPDLVISDLDMPVMDGLEMLRQIKRLAPDAKVLMMSGDATEKQVAEMEGAGIETFLRKPFEIPDLVAAVEKALSG